MILRAARAITLSAACIGSTGHQQVALPRTIHAWRDAPVCGRQSSFKRRVATITELPVDPAQSFSKEEFWCIRRRGLAVAAG